MICPVPPDHPGWRARLRPGDYRYACSFCDFFLDVPPPSSFIGPDGFFPTDREQWRALCVKRVEWRDAKLQGHLDAHVEDVVAHVAEASS